ncbi:nucleoside hydrolase [Pseudonocardiaceae bacterium YIM PH 21723]|nr:nucleoside hydrolase [Pseudonocardiaceae bacterium YIM PH 21723]
MGETPKVRVVVHSDPGADDAVALCYLAARPEVRIEAVGSVHGNVSAEAGAENALRVLERAGLPDVPVAVGAARPLAQGVETAEWVHGLDGLGGAAGPPAQNRPVPISAAEQLVTLARANPGELCLLELAPLTNLALALLLEPELPRLLKQVVVMGGAIGGPGNVTPFAEANFWHDPEAADLVLGAGFPLTLVGLNVTDSAGRADGEWLDRLAASEQPVTQWCTEVLGHYVGFYSGLTGERELRLHDPLAAMILLHPELAKYEQHRVSIELRGELTRGASLVDSRPFTLEQDESRAPVQVAVWADGTRFLDDLLEALG